jgi:ATP-dependent Clp protease ATP-binding subunit ClpA
MLAKQEGQRLADPEVSTEHLLYGIVSSPEGSYRALQRCKVLLPELSKAVEGISASRAFEKPVEKKPSLMFDPFGTNKKPANPPSSPSAVPFSKDIQRIFPRAMELSDKFESDVVRSEHILLALLTDAPAGCIRALEAIGVSPAALLAEVTNGAKGLPLLLPTFLS